MAFTKWFKKEDTATNDIANAELNAVNLEEVTPPSESEINFKLGVSYEYGDKGIQINLPEAVRHYALASEQGHIEAGYKLAICYEKGIKLQFQALYLKFKYLSDLENTTHTL